MYIYIYIFNLYLKTHLLYAVNIFELSFSPPCFNKILPNIKTKEATADRRNNGAKSREQRQSDIGSAL